MTKASGQGCCVVLVALSVCHYAYVTALTLTLVSASFAYLVSVGSFFGAIFLHSMFFDFTCVVLGMVIYVLTLMCKK